MKSASPWWMTLKALWQCGVSECLMLCPGHGFSCASWELWAICTCWCELGGLGWAHSIPCCLVGCFYLIFSFNFPFFLPFQPPQETIPQSDCCSGGEEHSLLGSSVALTLQIVELLSLLGPSLSHSRQFHSFLLWLIKPRSLSSQFPSVPRLPW